MKTGKVGSKGAGAGSEGDGNRVLVVLLCETRAWEITAERFISNVLDELSADLALCVGDREHPNPLYERAKYIWRLAEPNEWADAYDRAVGNKRWRVLLEVHKMWLGGIADAEHPQKGSGAIGLYFRRFLRESLEGAGIIDGYDWIMVTRSDFMWPIPHPDLRHLSNRHIYAFDGEHWGGLSDRHIIVPRRYIRPFLSVPDPVFTSPEDLKRRIDRTSAIQGWEFVNPERFLALRVKELGLWRRIRLLPYIPYAVRAPGGSTRWSEGVFSNELGIFLKYPTEMERSQVAQNFIRDQESWKQYFSPIRGAPMRREMKRILRKVDSWAGDPMYERAFPRFRRMRLRAYRWVRWTVFRHRRRGAARTAARGGLPTDEPSA